jgi:hypothetical protein
MESDGIVGDVNQVSRWTIHDGLWAECAAGNYQRQEEEPYRRWPN